MQIVIDIPEGLKQKIDEGFYNQDITGKLWDATKNGTPLPAGHGRLIDADDVDNHIIGHVDLRGCPTIIEADKKGEDQE